MDVIKAGFTDINQSQQDLVTVQSTQQQWKYVARLSGVKMIFGSADIVACKWADANYNIH